ncbi:hypothetical protein FRC09_016630, partial [Ceratobasidium sp. 395]
MPPRPGITRGQGQAAPSTGADLIGAGESQGDEHGLINYKERATARIPRRPSLPMSSPSVNTPFSDMRQTQFHSSFESASTLPSTLELPKPVLSKFSRASLEKVRRDTLLKFCEARPGVSPRTCELSDALAFLRAIRQ